MLRHLRNRRGLSVHSDVVTEPVVDLVEAGVVTGPVVASWAMGTRRLYDLLADDDRFSLHPVEHVCDPEVIAGHDRMVSVTQAFAVDLSGQVCTERLDGSALRRGLDRPGLPPRCAAGGARRPGGVPGVAHARPGAPAVQVALGPDEPGRRCAGRTCAGSSPSTARRTCSGCRSPSGRWR